MLNWKKMIQIPLFMTLAGSLTACGGQAYQTQTPYGNSPQGNYQNGNYPNSNQPYPSGSTTPSTPTNLPSAITSTFKLQAVATSSSVCGNPTPSGVRVGSATVGPINTDNLLDITITSGAPSVLPCSTKTMYYGCTQWTVTVTDGSYTQSQDVMVSYGNPTAGPCRGIPASKKVSFNPSSGHGPLTVTLSNPQIDNCRLFYGSADVSNSMNWILYCGH